MIRQKAHAILRYVAYVAGVSIAILIVIEAAGWLLKPDRYDTPPAVTPEAWIFSDALAPDEIPWMKEFVDEFCRSYTARWSSYVYFQRKPFRGKHINVDSSGIRATAQASARRDSGRRALRVFLMGGSTMWGTGARDSGTIPSALARVIGEDSAVGPAEIINLGESGYVSTQSVLRLELELRKGNWPDIVILYDGVNDVFAAYQNAEPGLPQNETHRAAEFNLLKERGRMGAIWLDSLLSRTVTGSFVRSLRSLIGPPSLPPPSHTELAQGILRAYGSNLEIVRALSKQFGFRYEAYWQPVVFTRPPRSPYERKQAELISYAQPLFLDVYRCLKEETVLGADPHFHDISGIFDSTQTQVYLDFCHITETGNAMVARRMFRDIRGELMVRRGKATSSTARRKDEKRGQPMD